MMQSYPTWLQMNWADLLEEYRVSGEAVDYDHFRQWARLKYDEERALYDLRR